MKPSGQLRRGKPLAAGKPLERKTPLRSRATTARARSRLRAKPLPAGERKRRAEVREDVFRRDGWRCQLAGVEGAGECFGGLSFHHRRKDGQGGGYTEENGSTLCVGHNDAIEADADLAAIARSLGLVLRAGDQP